jgi:hypothetical protein
VIEPVAEIEADIMRGGEEFKITKRIRVKSVTQDPNLHHRKKGKMKQQSHHFERRH